MNIDPAIFKAYDIRGIYPEQINAEAVYKIVQAYVKSFSPKSVALGHDMRLTGEEFSQAVAAGFVDAGVDVVDIGLVSTDTLYFAVVFLKVDGGVQVTASHNPKEFGGLKMVRAQGSPVSGDSGINQIKDLVISDKWQVTSNKKGTVTNKNIFEDYLRHVLKTFDLKKIKPLKIVVHTNFGMASLALKRLAEILPIKILQVIDGELNGYFPKGRPDPLVPENRGEIIAAIKQLHPDLGVAWDADADRCFFFDELGQFVTPAYINALLSEYYLRKNPGAKIIHDTRVVRVIDYTVKQNGGVAVMNKAGHSFIKERMVKEEADFGSETSGHYYFKDNFYLDNGLMPLLAILEILSVSGQAFSEILRPLREKFYISEEINFQLQNHNTMEEVRQHYNDAQLDQTDGYSFNYPAWRFNLRKSNTENLLRINLEADSAALLKQKTDEVVGLINKIK